MKFYEEPPGYMKTILSDLQGAWGNLRDAVVESHPFPGSDRLLCHIDEGMSWESVRNPRQMERTLLLVRNLALTNGAPDEVMFWIEDVVETLKETLDSGIR
ncbi:MAG: hypothetical protein V1792_29460 [Pseudomonadota bacterium]